MTMRTVKNIFALTVAHATIAITITAHAGVFNRSIGLFVADCYTSISPNGSNPITITLTRGVTPCNPALGQIGRTAIFGGDVINANECVGNVAFCCAQKDVGNIIRAIYCQNNPRV